MSKIGKIRVMHFLNTKIQLSPVPSSILKEDDKSTELTNEYPVYVLVTFRRQTTQMKSVIERNYKTIEEAISKEREMIRIETKMIESLINEHCEILSYAGWEYTLKGFNTLCKRFHQILFDAFKDAFLWAEFVRSIYKCNNEYSKLLETRNPEIPIITYYKAAIKLMDDKTAFSQLERRFIIVEQIEKLIKNRTDLKNLKIIEWVFGNAKEEFRINALNAGLEADRIEVLINSIDTGVNIII